jgi:L-ascorbate metabolism protein UlaG (beta-lactamase superfamily)
MDIALTWWGNATFLLEADDLRLLFDPWIKTNPGCTLGIENLPRLDAVLVTHGHPGHYGHGDSVEIAKIHACIYITNTVLGDFIERERLLPDHQIIRLAPGTDYEVGPARVSLVEIPHPPEPRNLVNHGVPGLPNCAFLIALPTLNLVYVGDTEDTPVYDHLRDKLGRTDIAILPLWSPAMADTEEVALEKITRVIRRLRPSRVVPHYRFDKEIRTPERLIECLSEEKRNFLKGVLVMRPGEQIHIRAE